jgi:uncharacterized protein (TIGR00251 family)
MRIGRGRITVEVAVRPGASRSAIRSVDDRGLNLDIAAPAERGKANEELLRMIASIVGAPRRSISILKGESSRRKVIAITSDEPAECAAMLIASTRRQ